VTRDVWQGTDADTAASVRTSGRPMVPAFDLLRAVACLGVVATHAITIALNEFGDISAGPVGVLRATQMLLMFSTPTFVFLSAAIVGHAYQQPPRGFLLRRLRFVAVPFLTMSVMYAVYYALKDLLRSGDSGWFVSEVVSSSLRNLAGGIHLWFIIPILQFYLLYAVFGRRLSRLPAGALGVALALNVAYLGYVNLAPPATDAYAQFIGKPWYGLLFPAWCFYFVVGLSVGARYADWAATLNRRLGPTVLIWCACGALLLASFFSGWLPLVASRRVDVLFYTCSVVALMVAVGARLSRTPGVLWQISRCAFGIYILHPLSLNLVWPWLAQHGDLPLLVRVIVLWLGGVAIAWLAVWLVSRVPAGSLLVGRVRGDRGDRVATGIPARRAAAGTAG
jgi:membrane-bound acyltransferase YfiQ involved in biofilm formation